MKIEEIQRLLNGELTTTAPIPALRVAQENKQKRLLEKTASVFENIVDGAERTIRSKGETIRSYRKLLDVERTSLKEMVRANEYMNATGNAWPLMKLLGYERTFLAALRDIGVSAPDHDDEGWKVPTDWALVQLEEGAS